MNEAQARPRTWTPHIILFSFVLHVVVIYYVAVAFNIVPPIIPTTAEPPVIRTVTLPPEVPVFQPVEKIKERPRFNQRLPDAPPIAPTVPPTPLSPVTSLVPEGPASLDVRQPIQEQPVAQGLPSYPRMAQDRGIEGRVVMSITIMPDGSVRDVRVVESSPRGYFESAAVRAVERWRYRPSNVIRTNVIVHMDFELKDG